MMDFVLLTIFKGIGGFQGYGFGLWHSSNIDGFGFWIWFFRHSSDNGGLQVLDLVLQAFIEYWWFSGFEFGRSYGLAFLEFHGIRIGNWIVISFLNLVTREWTCLKLIGWIRGILLCDSRMSEHQNHSFCQPCIAEARLEFDKNKQVRNLWERE